MTFKIDHVTIDFDKRKASRMSELEAQSGPSKSMSYLCKQ